MRRLCAHATAPGGIRSLQEPDKLSPVASDGELLEAWRAGDRGAGSELFDRHFEAVRRFFASKIDDDHEELVQQTFVACVGAKDRVDPSQGFRGYLFAVARSKLIDRLRVRQRRGAALDPEVDSVAAAGLSPSAALGRTREHELLLQALRRIPLDLQIALELYYFEGLHAPELAAALAIPLGTVRSRLRRGLEQVRLQLDHLASTPELRRSTSMQLDEWAEQVQAMFADER